MPIGVNSTSDEDATDWIAANWAIPEAFKVSRMTATRVTRGAICLSRPSHFPLRLNSKRLKPVAFPPGRARLAAKPLPTGSATATNTIGTTWVTCSSG
jgi:hypothetical protein